MNHSQLFDMAEAALRQSVCEFEEAHGTDNGTGPLPVGMILPLSYVMARKVIDAIDEQDRDF